MSPPGATAPRAPEIRRLTPAPAQNLQSRRRGVKTPGRLAPDDDRRAEADIEQMLHVLVVDADAAVRDRPTAIGRVGRAVDRHPPTARPVREDWREPRQAEREDAVRLVRVGEGDALPHVERPGPRRRGWRPDAD